MKNNFKNTWETLLTAQDQKQALVNHFSILTEREDLRALLYEVFNIMIRVEVQDETLVIYFEGDSILRCKAPASVIAPGIPESCATILNFHQFIQLEDIYSAPITFSGVDHQGLLHGSELVDTNQYFDLDETSPELEKPPFFQAFMLGQNEVVFNIARQNSFKEPSLYFVDHEVGVPKGPMADNLLFSEVLLLSLAEMILGEELLIQFKDNGDKVKIGSKSFPLDSEEVDLFQEELGDLSPDIALLTQLKKISLCQCKILSLPAAIGKLQHLEKLELMANLLEEIPVEIGNLKNLTQLDLSENRLKKIPASVGNLKKLQVLDLSDNALESLPEEIRNLSELKELQIEGKELKLLPEAITSLKNLKTLWILRSGISELPATIGNLSVLRKLNLIENDKLTALPESIGNLVNLEQLILNNCKSLKHIPSSIKNLTKIKGLSCSNTAIDDQSFTNLCHLKQLESVKITDAAITRIPKAIENLLQLRKLYLNNNPIEWIAPEIGKLQNLETFDLGDCQIKEIPSEIANLAKLESLSITGNNIQSIPESLSKLQQLSFVAMENVVLERIPDFIFRIPKLRILSLKNWDNLTAIGDKIGFAQNMTGLWISDCCKLHSLSKEIKNLQKFRSIAATRISNAEQILISVCGNPNVDEIIFTHTDLQSIPKDIANLEKLAELDLPNNQISYIPQEIRNMKKFWSLNLAGNRLQEVIPEVFMIEDLHTLNLSRNPISGIPEEAKNATNLRNLVLKDCSNISEQELERIKILVPQSFLSKDFSD